MQRRSQTKDMGEMYVTWWNDTGWLKSVLCVSVNSRAKEDASQHVGGRKRVSVKLTVDRGMN